MAVSHLDSDRQRRLLDAGQSLVAQLDLDAVLHELLALARELTGARYAALGVLAPDRRGVERFLTSGIDPEAHAVIGEPPRGRGVLGALIDDPRPLRLRRIRDDPRSFGFPPGHPPMGTFLGVPVTVRGEAWGNLYLTEKHGGKEFDDGDEEATMVLAAWAAIAVENARLYRDVEERRAALERAVVGLEATSAIARALGGETDLQRVLELIVGQGRTLVQARSLIVVLLDGQDLVVAAGAGETDAIGVGRRMSVIGSGYEQLLSGGRVGGHEAPDPEVLVVPLIFRDRALGVLRADGPIQGTAFDTAHQELLLGVAASAATAVATAQSVAVERLRESLDASERERRRWARELHDETLQALGALRVLLASGLRRGTPEALAQVSAEAVEQLSTEISALRTLITELRPAALDEFGLEPALTTLAERMRVAEGLRVDLHVDLATARGGRRLPGDLETAVYRVLQEALTNVAKHAVATSVAVSVTESDLVVLLEVRDDGVGFDPGRPMSGFGLVGMRERVELAGGRLTIESAPARGTTVAAQLGGGHRAPGAFLA